MAFWGDLESPISRQNAVRRNSSDDRNAQQSQYPPLQNAPARSNRISTQSQAPTVSTQSPFVSPTASSFKGDGLTPRPPSFTYGVPGGYSKDYLDKRRRRASRETEEYYRDSDNTAPPPAAPDAPRFPPPVNYKQSYSSTGPPASFPLPATSRSTRRPEGPVDANLDRTTNSYRDGGAEAKAVRPRVERGELSINTDYQRERRGKNSIGGAPEPPLDYPDKGLIRRGTVGARKEKPEYHDPAPPPRSRQVSAAETEAQRRREWAPDRSPLQRLELTLDSITKEEKRARVEEAELLAREAKAGRGGDRLNQNSVRFRNRPVAKTEAPGQSEPQSLAEAGLVRNLSNKQKDELQRSGTLEKKKPVVTDSAPARHLGKGFEYQPQQDTISVVREPEKSSVPQREAERVTRIPEKASVPQRGPSFRERVAIPAAAVAVAGAALSRSTSNKLKKEPPGDPWFSRRQEAERAYPEVKPRRPSVDARRDQNTMIGGPLGSAPVVTSARKVSHDIPKEEPKIRTAPPTTATVDQLSDEDFPQSAPVRRNPSSKIAQLTGYPIKNGIPRPMSPAQQQLYKDRLGLSEELSSENSQPGPSQARTEIKTASGIKYAVAPEVAEGTNGQDRATRRPDGHHNLSDIIHNRRSQYRPGDGLYASHQPLEEWKNGTTAALSGALLDLEVRQTEAEKDKAWWEAGHSGKRRTSSSKKPKIETYDGEYENSNGKVLPNLSDLEKKNYSPFVSVVGAQTWLNIQDPVVPLARHTIGYKGNRKVEVHRRNKFWVMRKNLLLTLPKRNLNGQDPLKPMSHFMFSPYSTTCPKISKHNIFHPFHVCPQDNFRQASKLTPAMRLIRVSTIAPTLFNPPLYLKCGPLLRYCGMRRERMPSRHDPESTAVRETWRGSVMIVTIDSQSAYNVPPTLRLFAQPMDLLPPPPDQVDGEAGELAPEYVDPIAGLPKIGRDGRTLYVRPVEHLEEEKDLSTDETDDGLFESHKSILESHGPGNDSNNDPKIPATSRNQKSNIDGEKLRKHVEVPGFRLLAEQGVTFWRFNIEVELRDQQQRIAYRINRGPATGFWIPARGQSMSIMFHSCNGFSLSVNPDQFSGPDPMWRDVLNTHQTQPFHVMLGGGDQIYNDIIMENTKLFSQWLNIKNPLEKHNAPFTPHMQEELETFYLDRYSMWFSQGLFGLANSQIPMVNIFDDHDIIDGYGSYPHSFMDAPVFAGLGAIAFKYYMLFQHQSVINEGEETEPSWLLGARPGPFIKELSRSVFMSLGSHIAFLGLDCRTEREQDTVLTDATYTKIFDRMHEQIIKGETKHLIVLLGVPIAYPRLVWLENILTSRLMDPIKAIGRAPMFGNLISTIDGGVEVLDDLNDHWTAKNHKKERRLLVEDLQDLAVEKSIRVTILSGDVHLAAIGQFFSNPKLAIPKHQDFRYMPNVISSAIVNTPPPNALADILNRRNKVHHLDDDTDEDMIPLFTKDVNGANRNNKRLLPRRNWCSIREYNPDLTPPSTPSDERSPSPLPRGGLLRRLSSSRGPSYRPDVGPPPSRGLMRNFSLRGRSSEDSDRPGIRQRTLSLSRNDFLSGNLFRRNFKRKPDDGGINGYGASSEEDEPVAPPLRPPKLRGGAGDESYYPPVSNAPFSRTRISRNVVLRDDGNGYTASDDTPDRRLQSHHQQWLAQEPQRRPFHRTPTGFSEKQLRKLGESHDVNLEGGLDICLNVEVNQKDPAGITMPYRLLVPALWYDDLQEDQNGGRGHERKASGLMRLVSFGRSKTDKSAWKGKGREENSVEEAKENWRGTRTQESLSNEKQG